jgi:hypothetical protein
MPAGERFDVDRAECRLRLTLGDAAFLEQFEQGASADPNGLVSDVESLPVNV